MLPGSPVRIDERLKKEERVVVWTAPCQTVLSNLIIRMLTQIPPKEPVKHPAEGDQYGFRI